MPATDRQREIYKAIGRYWRDHGHAPSIREIGAAVGIGTANGVRNHLVAMRRKGYLTFDEGKARSIRLLKSKVCPCCGRAMNEEAE